MAAIRRSVLALDVGEKRVGVAVASWQARLPRPLVALPRQNDFFDRLQTLISEEDAGLIVIGWPRGLSGQHTAQTAATEAFGADVQERTGLSVRYQDEALTSVRAEAELQERGKLFQRGDVDALAATYILEDFLRDHPEEASA